VRRLVLIIFFLLGCATDAAPAAKDDHQARTRRAYDVLRQPGNTVGTILDVPPRESEPMVDGGVRLRFWVQVPGGASGDRFIHREVVFDVEGRIVGGRDLEARASLPDQRP
jgi:hypothetical protein